MQIDMDTYMDTCIHMDTDRRRHSSKEIKTHTQTQAHSQNHKQLDISDADIVGCKGTHTNTQRTYS
jgi:hypothetical protein